MGGVPVSSLFGLQPLCSKRHQLSFFKQCVASVAHCSFEVCARRQVWVPVLASGSNCAVKPTRLRRAAYFRSLVPSPALCAQPPVPALGPVPKAYLPFWPPALASQAPPAIIPAVLRRFRGPALFLGLRPSSRQGAPFWPSGLTLRSSGLAFSQALTLAVSALQVKNY